MTRAVAPGDMAGTAEGSPGVILKAFVRGFTNHIDVAGRVRGDAGGVVECVPTPVAGRVDDRRR